MHAKGHQEQFRSLPAYTYLPNHILLALLAQETCSPAIPPVPPPPYNPAKPVLARFTRSKGKPHPAFPPDPLVRTVGPRIPLFNAFGNLHGLI